MRLNQISSLVMRFRANSRLGRLLFKDSPFYTVMEEVSPVTQCEGWILLYHASIVSTSALLLVWLVLGLMWLLMFVV